jgi:hypothetical protein
MATKDLLPKRVVRYIHEMGVRSLDHLANNFDAAEESPVKNLVNQWKTMSTPDKELFVERVGASVVEVVAASAVLPLGLKLGKKAAKAAKKVIKKRAKRIRKAAKKAPKAKAKKKKA